MTTFEGVIPALAEALSKRGYEELTPVQTAVLVPELQGRDALVSAQTGSGKTVAFGLAIAEDLLKGSERFDKARFPMALVIAPTRELAMQVKKELEWLYEITGAKIASCVGGMDIRGERRNLANGAHIVVGTPGRLCDHIKRRSLDISNLKAVILDEADEMLDLGFREELEFILETAPEDRRTLMFSATVPRTITGLAKRYQRNPIRIETKAEQRQHSDIEYRALLVSASDRENAIINILRFYDAKNAIVFCSTRAMVKLMTARFSNRGFSVVALSGELSQNERTHALQAMRDGRARVCIATDVAARGIDLPDLELVVHADLPKTSETLLHRSGRTGRAGKKGVCTIIVPHSARKKAERLLRFAKIQAEWARPPTADEILRKDDERLLNDPVLQNDILPQEEAMATKLVEAYGAEKLAAALVRIYRKDYSAPEDLADDKPIRQSRDRADGQNQVGRRRAEGRNKSHNDFDNGVWFSLSVGRKHNAEPKWLIPMLCRAGDFSKRQIGAIKINDVDTHVEIDPTHVEKFTQALGKQGMLEKSISVKRIASDAISKTDHKSEKQVKKRQFGAKNQISSEDESSPEMLFEPPRKSRKKSKAKSGGKEGWAKRSKKSKKKNRSKS